MKVYSRENLTNAKLPKGNLTAALSAIIRRRGHSLTLLAVKRKPVNS